MRKFAWLLIAVVIAVYAGRGLMLNDLVMPYRWWGNSGGVSTTRFVHLRDMWALGGAACLLLGAAGFIVLFFGSVSAKPGTKAGAEPYRKLATGLILVGGLFFIAVSVFGHWFIR
jgi:hypothetical protein